MNLNPITISVSDVERSIQFYQGLGLRHIVKALPCYATYKTFNRKTPCNKRAVSSWGLTSQHCAKRSPVS